MYVPQDTSATSHVRAYLTVYLASPIRPQSSPKTPQGTPHGSLLPLDPSCLSISNNNGGFAESGIAVPVTPTTTNQARRLVTPVHTFAQSRMEVDDYLLHHFSRVDEVGCGEFSAVYRVAYPKRASLGLGSSAHVPPGSPPPGRAYAVKKSRRPFQGNRDRDIKLKEVRILKSLGNAQHVLHYVNSWERSGHLYIQTEYCDEGSLQKFLSEIGRQGRLDDFRIWKIIQDLTLVCILRSQSSPKLWLTDKLAAGTEGNPRGRLHPP